MFLFACEKPGSEDVEEAKETYQIVLVDFYGDGCPPCRKISPIIDEIEEEYPEIKVLKVNINEEDGIHSKYNITKIPTVVIYHNGRSYARFIGFHDKSTYLKPIETILKYESTKKGH